MENIKDVYLDLTALEQLPFTIGNLVGLQRLFLRGCQRMIQLPSYILPKVEIITTYGCRGFRSSENEEKMSPKVFPSAMCVYNEYGQSFLNVYAHYITSNNVIEVCSPLCETELIEFEPSRRRLLEAKLRNNKSSISFWFRNKFPKIVLWFNVEPENYFDNMVLDFKFNVLINRTKQLTSSCEYIFYTQNNMNQLLCCGLQCKVEGVFLENESNHVEILSEIKHFMPCDSKTVTVYRDWTTKRILKWFAIYVFLDN
jgi:hypothetical protein